MRPIQCGLSGLGYTPDESTINKLGNPAVRDVRGPDEDHGDRGGELVVSRLLYQRAEGAEVSYTAKLDNGRGSVAGAPR